MGSRNAAELAATAALSLLLAATTGMALFALVRAERTGRQLVLARQEASRVPAVEAPGDLDTRITLLEGAVRAEIGLVYRPGEMVPTRFGELVGQTAARAGLEVRRSRPLPAGSAGAEVEIVVAGDATAFASWLRALSQHRPEWPVVSLRVGAADGQGRIESTLRVGYRVGGVP
jgi:hypothetical protein